MSLFSSRYRDSWSFTNVSKNLETAGKTDIGLQFDLSSDGPSVNMGATLATFQLSGKAPEYKEKFKYHRVNRK